MDNKFPNQLFVLTHYISSTNTELLVFKNYCFVIVKYSKLFKLSGGTGFLELVP